MLKYSLKDFLTAEIELLNNDETLTTVKIDKIEIPMIQRDYAQGRLSYYDKEASRQLNTTGEKFISELFDFLTDSDTAAYMDLDFVYGSIEDIENVKYFYPLDGQQRLTTLFLLYWFIGGAELQIEERSQLADVLKRFYYATRTSSNAFCENLVEALKHDEIDFFLIKPPKVVDKIEIEPAQNIITQIENFSWFHDSYKLDPTVQAMLNMIGQIQELYVKNKCSSVFKNLEKIRFYVLPLNNFDLTEELYVKMNARGKQLTNFENFKADFQNWIKINSDSMGFADCMYAGRKMPYDMVLINKMDNEWAAMFWDIQKYCENKNFDQRFLSFIYKYWLNAYIVADHPGMNNKAVAKESTFTNLNRDPVYEKFDIFAQQITDSSFIKKFENTLDNLAENFKDISKCIQPIWNSTFELLTETKVPFKEQAVFGAVVLYLQQTNFSKDSFQKWMRIVWNIVENADIDHDHVLISVMQLISELAPHSNDIYNYLANPAFSVNSKQSECTIEEECTKAKLILTDSEWIAPILEAESHSYFKGSINFLIPDDEDLSKFIHNYQMALIFFDDKGVSEKYRNNSHIFLRALLSRYHSLSKIQYHITDISESENSLKKMLSSDPVVKDAIKEWFSLESEEDIEQKLFEEVSKVSPIAVIDDDFEKKLHESLYKETDLIDWMQENRAIRYKDNYVSRPASSADWVYVYGYQNEIASQLVDADWKCEKQCYIGNDNAKRAIPYFWSREEILLKKYVCHMGKDILFKCSIDKTIMSISVGEYTLLTTNPIDTIKYANQLPNFMNLISTTISDYLSTL